MQRDVHPPGWRNRPHFKYEKKGIKDIRGPPSRYQIVPAVDLPPPEEGEASSFLYSMAHHEHAGKRIAATSAAGSKEPAQTEVS